MRSIRLPALVTGALVVVACAASPVSPSPQPLAATPSPAPSAATRSPLPSDATPSPTAAFATGCLSLDEADCGRVRDLVLASLAAGTPPAAYVEVGPFACRVDPCPETIAARPSGRVTIEFADGSKPVVLEVSIEAGVLTTRPTPQVFLVAVPPSSKKLAAPQATIELGHCGLLSGIDVDGSFWNPIGHVDMTNQDSINAAQAEFVLTTPATARLTTANGLELELVRHPGAKHLPPCM